MYYRVPGFLAVVSFGFYPRLPYVQVYLYISLPVCRRSSLLTGEGGGRSQIVRRRESPVLYNLLTTILPYPK